MTAVDVIYSTQRVVVDPVTSSATVVTVPQHISVNAGAQTVKITQAPGQTLSVDSASSTVKVISRTQRIEVNPAALSAAVINAGPMGPRGLTGPEWPTTVLAEGEVLTKELGTLVGITRADLAGDPAFTAAMTAHTAAADPHPGYLTTAEGAVLLGDHEAASDPHPVYLRASEAVTSLAGTAGEIDVSGSTGAITLSLPASISANAATATKLATPRDLSLTGHVTASAVSFDGSANAALSTLIASGVVTNAMLSAATGEPNNASWVAYTPVVQSGGVNVTLGVSGSATGVYIRLGKWIYCMGDVRFSTSSGAAMTAGTITVGLPTVPTLFANSLLLLGNLRATGLTGGLFFHAAHPIGTVASQQVSWKYSAAYPSGADANFTTTTPNTLILNAANAFRVSWTCLYLSST